ncbi:hypothetical protein TNCV_3766891 [Trichonephila clavipes]|nr:hypothetical protein TNCV_3766891 [Trichonephila clavipes]
MLSLGFLGVAFTVASSVERSKLNSHETGSMTRSSAPYDETTRFLVLLACLACGGLTSLGMHRISTNSDTDYTVEVLKKTMPFFASVRRHFVDTVDIKTPKSRQEDLGSCY